MSDESRENPAKGTPPHGPDLSPPLMNPGDQAPAGTPGTGENLCRDCRGTGRRGSKPCPTCGGTGRVTEGISAGP
jgi:hypothetical protein